MPQVDHVWLGEGRLKATGDWYTLFTTCRLSRVAARDALIAHPNHKDFDRVRIRKFTRRQFYLRIVSIGSTGMTPPLGATERKGGRWRISGSGWKRRRVVTASQLRP